MHVRRVNLAEANRTGLRRNAPHSQGSKPVGQGKRGRDRQERDRRLGASRKRGDVMLDGKRYFASFPDEVQAAPKHENQDNKARGLTPGLIAALAELDRELRSFLDEASAATSDETSDDRRT